jgi:hypothetical protein
MLKESSDILFAYIQTKEAMFALPTILGDMPAWL